MKLIVGLLLWAVPAAAQTPRIGIIDFYGARTVALADLRRVLGVTEGDSLAVPAGELRRRLEAVPGVIRASVNAVCCEDGASILYVGIEETGSPGLRFREPPTGAIRLRADIVAAGEEFDRALQAAVRRGNAREDDSQGHALMEDSAARAVQERFLGFAARDLDHLRAVLRESADSAHRALAAWVIGYAADKRQIVGDLVPASRDPASEVRNNAVRALGVIAGYARAHPDLGITVPLEPFVALLNSPVWTDRNKGSLAVFQLTGARDSTVLARLKAEALPALSEMARWKAPGHAFASFLVVARIAGVPAEEAFAAFERGDREAVIAAAAR